MAEDLQAGFDELKALLLKRMFSSDVELLAVHDITEGCRVAERPKDGFKFTEFRECARPV